MLARFAREVGAPCMSLDERTDAEQVRLEGSLASLLRELVALLCMTARKLELARQAIGLRQEYKHVRKRAFVPDLAATLDELPNAVRARSISSCHIQTTPHWNLG